MSDLSYCLLCELDNILFSNNSGAAFLSPRPIPVPVRLQPTITTNDSAMTSSLNIDTKTSVLSPRSADSNITPRSVGGGSSRSAKHIYFNVLKLIEYFQ
jgi:hypothetical protein